MPDVCLSIDVGGSTLRADPVNLDRWRDLLNCADRIGLAFGSRERVSVNLSGQRRWIAFTRNSCGSPLYCVGYQETVGAFGGNSGSNRKVLCWLMPDDSVRVE